jgi:hypothetical protein
MTLSETLRSEIHKLINSIWKKEELPDQWKESVIVASQEGLSSMKLDSVLCVLCRFLLCCVVCVVLCCFMLCCVLCIVLCVVLTEFPHCSE